MKSWIVIVPVAILALFLAGCSGGRQGHEKGLQFSANRPADLPDNADRRRF